MAWERRGGIEPPSRGWKPRVLPLDDRRKVPGAAPWIHDAGRGNGCGERESNPRSELGTLVSCPWTITAGGTPHELRCRPSRGNGCPGDPTAAGRIAWRKDREPRLAGRGGSMEEGRGIEPHAAWRAPFSKRSRSQTGLPSEDRRREAGRADGGRRRSRSPHHAGAHGLAARLGPMADSSSSRCAGGPARRRCIRAEEGGLEPHALGRTPASNQVRSHDRLLFHRL